MNSATANGCTTPLEGSHSTEQETSAGMSTSSDKNQFSADATQAARLPGACTGVNLRLFGSDDAGFVYACSDRRNDAKMRFSSLQELKSLEAARQWVVSSKAVELGIANPRVSQIVANQRLTGTGMNFCVVEATSSEPVGCVGVTAYDDGSEDSCKKLICKRGFRTIEVPTLSKLDAAFFLHLRAC